MCLLWSVDAWCASRRCCDLFHFFSSAVLKPTLANAAGETRAAPSFSSLLCFSPRDIFHIWCCVHTAAVVVYKLLACFWVFLSRPSPLDATTSCFSMHADWPLRAQTLLLTDLCQCWLNPASFRVTLTWTCRREQRWFSFENSVMQCTTCGRSLCSPVCSLWEESVSSSPVHSSYLLSAERTDAFVTHWYLI